MALLMYVVLALSFMGGSADAESGTPISNRSVEIGLAELSPKGAAGGIAVPASGSSYSCSLSASPSSINQGQSSNISWSHTATGASDIPIHSLELYRCNTGTACNDATSGTLSGSWALVHRSEATYTNEQYCPNPVWEHGVMSCPGGMQTRQTPSYVSPSGSASAGSSALTPNNYKFRLITVLRQLPGHNDSTALSCDANLEVKTSNALAVTCSASPSAISVGGSTTWTATATGGGGAGTYTYSWSGTDGLTGASSSVTKTYSSAGTKTASVTVTSNGSSTGSVACGDVDVGVVDPTVDLRVKNTTTGTGPANSIPTLNTGEQIELSWTSTNATTCSAVAPTYNFSTGGLVNSGSSPDTTVDEPAASSTRSYRISCTGPGGSDTDVVTVAAEEDDCPECIGGGPPTLTADPEYVHVGDDSTLLWNLNGNNPSMCTLTGPGVSMATLSSQTGTTDVAIYGESTFTLVCPGGTDEAIVKVLPVVQET